MLHPESLFLVHDHETDLLEDHIGREKSVRSHHQINRAVGEPLHDIALFRGAPVAAEKLDPHRILAHPLAQGTEVLLGQHRRGCEEDHLPSSHERFESRPQRDLRLTEADIAAEEPIHRPARLHVLLDLGDRA